MPTISAVALPDHLAESQLHGQIAVVIDVLRATTTIAHALSQGASCIIPVASIDAARMMAHERHGSLLCGERSGIKPEGFQLGNSPEEYTEESVSGRDIVLTTTNGTRALQMCTDAHTIYTGSITNLDVLARELRFQDRDVVLVCSGTDRRASLEDCICAGLIVQQLQPAYDMDDIARVMMHAALGAIESNGGLEPAIASSFHAKRLVEKGFRHDLHNAARLGASTCVPCFDPATGEIRPAPQLNRSHG
jgi:2-phosphosulfolactate phosphatase